MAKEKGFNLTMEEADTYFCKLNPKDGELGDDELDDVTGGRKCLTTYKDGRPVVTFFNSCEHYWWVRVPDSDGGTCQSCGHCVVNGIYYLCFCPERFNN